MKTQPRKYSFALAHLKAQKSDLNLNDEGDFHKPEQTTSHAMCEK